MHAANLFEIRRQLGHRPREIAAERHAERFRCVRAVRQKHDVLRQVVAVVGRKIQHMHQRPAFGVEHVFRLFLIRSRRLGPFRSQLFRGQPRPGEKKIRVRVDILPDAHAFAVDLSVGVQLGRAFFKPARQRRGRLVQQEMHELMRHHARQLAAGVGHDIVAFQAALIQARSRFARSVLAELFFRIEQHHAQFAPALVTRG